MFQNEAQGIIESYLGPINIYNPKLSNQGNFGCFQLNDSNDRAWIHSDPTSYIGLCYLNPDPPLNSGTTFYKHKQTTDFSEKSDNIETYIKDKNDFTKWEVVDTIGNRFNRTVIYNSSLFHCPTNYFGSDLQTSRLYQLFFFDLKGSA